MLPVAGAPFGPRVTLRRLGAATVLAVGASAGSALVLRWLAGRRPAADPRRPAERRSLQEVAGDLRRLLAELGAVPVGAAVPHSRELVAAYDEVLAEAAELLEVPQQLLAARGAGRELERIRLLGELEAAGLAVVR